VADVAGVAGPLTLGWTKIDKASNLICAADLVANAAASTCTVKSRPVSLSITSKYAKAGPPAPSGLDMELPQCGKKKVPVYMQITPAIEKKAIAGEKEHCDDLQLAFDRTLGPCSAALAKFDGKTVPGKNDGECYKSLVGKLGFDPLDCTGEFIALANKTDERDTKGWHDFDPVRQSVDCNRIVVGNTPAATNKIGDASVAPASHIPASTKCGVPAPAGPSMPPKVSPPPGQPSPGPTPSPGPGPSPAPSPSPGQPKLLEQEP
jgi:hypothetical protein